MKGIKFFIGGLSLAMFFTACGGKKAGTVMESQVKTYPVATVTPQSVELQSVYPAVIKGQEDIDIKPRIDGFIETIYVDEGAVVRKGQALFKINSPLSVQNFENAQANFNTAKLDVERMHPLAEKGIISKVRLSTYENNFASAKAALEQAKASIGWTTVTSPVDGVVGSIAYRNGSLVNNTNVLTTVANTTNVIAYFSMNEKELYEFMRSWNGNSRAEKIKNMPSVKLILSDGSEYEDAGKIQTISGVVDATSGSVSFRALFPNKQGLLLSGTSGKVVIPQLIKDVLVVPQKATTSQQDKILIYKVVADSVVQKIIKVKAMPDGKNFAVFAGIEAGDVIVTDGLATLKNGQKIKF